LPQTGQVINVCQGRARRQIQTFQAAEISQRLQMPQARAIQKVQFHQTARQSSNFFWQLINAQPRQIQGGGLRLNRLAHQPFGFQSGGHAVHRHWPGFAHACVDACVDTCVDLIDGFSSQAARPFKWVR
jgi:hypothetical protein